ncbi:MAG: murein transglycosylase [Oscillatoria sp. SIO1A7]|nr:murein transglycosylase [Oscillatoria sp. SIO1A7]
MMKKLALIAATVGTTLGIFLGSALSQEPLRPMSSEELSECCQIDLLGWDELIWGIPDRPDLGAGGDRQALLAAIDNSLQYLDSQKAVEDYQKYDAVEGITRDRVRRSLERFRELLLAASGPSGLQAAVRREFIWYRSVGYDGRGTVAFTGYFEPTYAASRVPTEEYRYPLYGLPPDLADWPKPHPTRSDLEGEDGTGRNSPLKGSEIVWLRDRLESFLVHIQGSARLQLADGTVMTVNYVGNTDYSYTSIGTELVKDGKMRLEDVTLPSLIEYFQQHPAELNDYLPRNSRFIFFQETDGSPAMGFIKVPVTPERSIATDKSLMPPGALAAIYTQIPYANQRGELEERWASRYVLDHDAGGAITGPGRVDIFMGTGSIAGDRAGIMNATGQLYYLLLKE